jgi:hypothetical protein
MADSPLALHSGKQISPADEIYHRNSAGKLGKRLGVVGDLVPLLECYQVTVVKTVDERRIIDAINGILEENRLDALTLSYGAILDTFQTYVDHGLADTLERTHSLCTESAGAFCAALEKAINAFSPHTYRDLGRNIVKNALSPIVTAADAYLIILAIAFHSITKRAPRSASTERVVGPKVDAAIKLLEDRLQRTLLPLGNARRSPMAALLFRGDEKWFLYFYSYCEGYEGEAGIVRMVAEANEKDDEDGWDGHKVSRDIPYDSYLTFADTLIQLIGRFKALRSIRLNFDPDAAPLRDPRDILTHSGKDITSPAPIK